MISNWKTKKNTNSPLLTSFEACWPDYVELTRAQAAVRRHRSQMRTLIQSYKIWRNQQPFANVQSILRLKLQKAWTDYRDSQKFAQFLAHKDNMEFKPSHPVRSEDFFLMSEERLYEYLETKYGPGFARKIVDGLPDPDIAV